jgi:lactate racemase
VARADLVVTVGVVEPHLYAGFSGGVKGVAIGCAGQKTIAWTHYPAFISRPGVEVAGLRGNPFQETLREIAALTGLRFAVNCVMDHGGGLTAVLAGDPVAVQEELARRFRPVWLHQADGPYDVVVAGIAAPKDRDLYQASRAATYVGLAARPAVRDGGLIVLAAGLADGFGDGAGEANFGRVLADAKDAGDVVRRGLREPLGPGGQRAFVLAKVLQRVKLALLDPERPDAFGALAHLGVGTVTSLPQALAAVDPATRDPRVLVVADAMATVVHA